MPSQPSGKRDIGNAALFAGVVLFWLAVYFGSPLLRFTPPRTIGWDPVRFVPFSSAFIFPYMSTYAMAVVVFVLIKDSPALRRIAAVFAAVILVSGFGFVLWPLELARPALFGATVSDRLLAWMYSMDRTGNFFPSLHVSMSFLFAFAVGHVRPRWFWPLAAWAALVAVSTLFTREHYVIDAVGGAVLAAAAWGIFFMSERRTRTSPDAAPVRRS